MMGIMVRSKIQSNGYARSKALDATNVTTKSADPFDFHCFLPFLIAGVDAFVLLVSVSQYLI